MHKAAKRHQRLQQPDSAKSRPSDALNESVATKADLLIREAGLRSEMQEVRSEL